MGRVFKRNADIAVGLLVMIVLTAVCYEILPPLFWLQHHIEKGCSADLILADNPASRQSNSCAEPEDLVLW
jgi:hypothetical protein